MINKSSAHAGPVSLSFLVLLLFSCAGPSSSLPTKGTRIVEGVPFYPQEEYQCGPATLAGVLNYYGVKVTPADIAAEIFSRHARGTLDMDMVFYTQKKGLKAAESFYRKAIREEPENADAYNNLAWLYYMKKENLDQAEKLAQRALELNPAKGDIYRDTLEKIREMK